MHDRSNTHGGSVRRTDMVDCVFKRPVVWLQDVWRHHANALAFALILVMITPAAPAEWTGVDQAILTDVKNNTTDASVRLQEIVNLMTGVQGGGSHDQMWELIGRADLIEADTNAIVINTTGIFNNLNTIIGHIDNLEALVTLIEGNTESIDNLAESIKDRMNNHIQPDLKQVVTNTANINTKLETLIEQSEPGEGTYSGSGITTPNTFIPNAPDVSATLGTPQGNPYFEASEEEPEEFEEPEDLEPGEFTFEAPTKSGLSEWGVSIPLSGLGTYFGIPTSETINLTTDMTWYAGAPRTAIHAAILAIVGIFAAMFIFEEFRRYA